MVRRLHCRSCSSIIARVSPKPHAYFMLRSLFLPLALFIIIIIIIIIMDIFKVNSTFTRVQCATNIIMLFPLQYLAQFSAIFGDICY